MHDLLNSKKRGILQHDEGAAEANSTHPHGEAGK